MADFKAGDRVVKMSGAAAGKYGTVNSVREDGTLNVTFDGERLPRYCDPDRCGQVAENAKFKVGDKVKVIGADNVIDEMAIGEVAKVTRILRDGLYWISGSGFAGAFKEGVLQSANSRAANAVEFTNPNYRPEAGMRFLDEHFDWFDPKVAKQMIDDARRKGVRVPPGVIEKARRAGLIANARAANAVRNERIRAYPDGPGEWILVDSVGDEGVGRTTATDERGIKAQLADIAVRTYRWHRPEIVIMREKYYSNAARNVRAANGSSFGHDFKVGDLVGMRMATPYSDIKMRITRIDGDKIYTDNDNSQAWSPEELHYWNAARNARALNWNYRNSYQFFCVDPSMRAPCIYSGWDYREDAKDDAAELKEFGIPHKIVSRRFLEQNGIDPNAEISWKKNR